MSDNTMPRPLFWLHVKKSAGGTVRRLLGPHYLQAERLRKPVNFIQSDPAAWNDILNNFRIPLGEYQFRRCLFARRYLYPDSWEARLRFAFARHPVERAVSAFFYLRVPRGGQNSFVHHARKLRRPVPEKDGGLFDLFLDLVEEARRLGHDLCPGGSAFHHPYRCDVGRCDRRGGQAPAEPCLSCRIPASGPCASYSSSPGSVTARPKWRPG